jgi:hypothetical protein
MQGCELIEHPLHVCIDGVRRIAFATDGIDEITDEAGH